MAIAKDLKPELKSDIESVLQWYPDEYKMAYEMVGNLYSENATYWPVAYIENILKEIRKRDDDKHGIPNLSKQH